MTAQEEFDSCYITSTEICQRLDLTRSALIHARRAGRLPEPVRISGVGGQILVMLWRRTEAEPHLEQWRQQLSAWRGAA